MYGNAFEGQSRRSSSGQPSPNRLYADTDASDRLNEAEKMTSSEPMDQSEEAVDQYEEAEQSNLPEDLSINAKDLSRGRTPEPGVTNEN